MAYTTVPKSTDYFNTKLYTGNSSADHAITGVGHQPDLVWLKRRTSATDHTLYDAIRGATKGLRSESADAEATSTGLTSFDSDGFTVGSAGTQNGGDMVSWNWKANGQGSSNTDGSINTTYTSANTTSGFSICQWTGTGSNATIGHGLGVAPKMILVKRTNLASDWSVYHNSLAVTDYLVLNTNAGKDGGGATLWNSTAPTNSVFSIGTDATVNASGSTYIAYCFSDIQGFSKAGSYTGNGNANGIFQYLGFKPAYVLIKNTQANETWMLYDDKRGYNGLMAVLSPDETAAEISANNIDLLSNGFKIRTSASTLNTNAQSFIYMAFAEAPLVGTNNVPANAR